MNQIVSIILFLLLVSGTTCIMESRETAKNKPAYAHSFIPDDLSTYLTLVYRTQVELLLTNINFPSNASLALQHAENTADLMDDAFYMGDSRDDSDFVKKYNQALNNRNSTIDALVLANILDQVLTEYGKAYDIDYDPTNMSNMMMKTNMSNIENISPMMRTKGSENSSSLVSSNLNMSQAGKDNDSPALSGAANYQSSQRLSEIADDVFRNILLSSPTQSINNTHNKMLESKIEKNLVKLNDLVNSNATIQDLMMLVHGEIHPNLQLAYNLRLKQ